MEQPYSGQKRKLGKPVVYELSSSSSAKSCDSFNGKRKKSIVLDQFTGEKIKQMADNGHEQTRYPSLPMNLVKNKSELTPVTQTLKAREPKSAVKISSKVSENQKVSFLTPF